MSAEPLIFGQDGGGAAPAADLVKETTTQDFRADVLDASRSVPVLVDFWAPWCGPCRQLTPVLEKVVKAAKGKVRLVKMNIDDHPQIAGQLGIQSIPAVIAFKDGQPLDGFMGAIPESQVAAFIDRIAGPVRPERRGRGAGRPAPRRLPRSDYAGAAALYSGVLQAEPDNMAALGGLIRCFVALGELAQARGLLAGLTPEQENDPAIAGARAALELASQAEKLGGPAELTRRLEADPNDHQARFDLAVVLNGRATAPARPTRCLRSSSATAPGTTRRRVSSSCSSSRLGARRTRQRSAGRQRLSSLLFA